MPYADSQAAKEYHREYMRRYRKTEKSADYEQEYQQRTRPQANARSKKYLSAHPERRKETIQKWRETPAGRATSLLAGLSTRASRKGIAVTITKEWLIEKLIAGQCEVTNLPFDFAPATTRQNPYAPSLDRTDPNGGYTPDNVKVVVWIYNVSKLNFTHEDVLKLAKALV